LLKLLLERDGILMKDIVEELDIRPSSASELVAKLEKRGFVRTETDAHDKRAKRVYTTEKTRAYSDRLKAVHGEVIAEVLTALSEEEQAQLLTLLRKIAASLEERPEAEADIPADAPAERPEADAPASAKITQTESTANPEKTD
jgi:DNA-binding MarR family transcriptional regulator